MKWILVIGFCLTSSLFAQQQKFNKEVLQGPSMYSNFWQSAWNVKKVPVFQPSGDECTLLFENGYAQSTLKEQWPQNLSGYIVREVNMIISDYPRNKDHWRTNYYRIMADRLRELFSLNISLNDTAIQYNLILQTACNTGTEAKAMFHGFEVKYSLVSEIDSIINEKPISQDSLDHIALRNKLEREMKRSRNTNFIVLDALDGIPLDSTLIVVDCTGSMRPFTSQVLFWMTDHIKTNEAKYFALFTDADLSRTTSKKIKRVYTGSFDKVSPLIKLFRRAQSLRGYNRETAENDIEAILKGLEVFPDLKSVILIADNNSPVMDISSVSCINVPVSVIPCGSSVAPHPHYTHIVAQTGGMFYAGKEGWISFEEYESGTPFIVAGNMYSYHKKKKYFICTKAKQKLFNADYRFYRNAPVCE